MSSPETAASGASRETVSITGRPARRSAAEPALQAREGPRRFPMIVSALQRIVQRQDLTRHEARDVLNFILSGHANEIQIAGLLVALAMKGESVDELTGFAQAMRDHIADSGYEAENLAQVQESGTGHDALISNGALVDTCGTGGDASGTFNISTAAAFTAAGAGLRIAKHGNRALTSRCGSADVIEALGVNLSFPVSRLRECLDTVGIAFFFAPLIHTAMRYVQPARRELRVRTIFNLLGPLTNPAGADAQVVGVYSAALTGKLARVLAALGARRAFVVHGDDGLDEITTTAPTRVAEVREGEVHEYVLDARELGFERATLQQLSGGDLRENVRIVRAILDGQRGPKRDIVVLNTAAALVAGGMARDLPEGVQRASDSLDSGAARAALEQLVVFTNS